MKIMDVIFRTNLLISSFFVSEIVRPTAASANGTGRMEKSGDRLERLKQVQGCNSACSPEEDCVGDRSST